MAEEVKTAAEAHIKLHYPRKNGSTEYDDYCQLEKTTKKRHHLLDEENPPVHAQFVWHLYWSKLRGSSISLIEIKAYQDLYGVTLSLWEIDLIFLIHTTVENWIGKEEQRRIKQK